MHIASFPDEKPGYPVASPIVRGYLYFVRGQQRRVGGKQAPSLSAFQLRGLVQNSTWMLRTPTERVAMIWDATKLCVAFHTMKHGFELLVAAASQVLQPMGGEGLIFNIMFRKTLRSSSTAVVIRNILDHCEIRAVISDQIYATGTRRRSRASVPERSTIGGGEQRELALKPE